MLRIAITEIVLFLSPFLAYALWLWLERRAGRTFGKAGANRLVFVALAGFLMMIAGFVFLAVSDPPHTGTYRPAEFRDGVLVPGRFE